MVNSQEQILLFWIGVFLIFLFFNQLSVKCNISWHVYWYKENNNIQFITYPLLFHILQLLSIALFTCVGQNDLETSIVLPWIFSYAYIYFFYRFENDFQIIQNNLRQFFFLNFKLNYLRFVQTYKENPISYFRPFLFLQFSFRFFF